MIDSDKQLRIRRGEDPRYFPVSYSRLDRFKACRLWYRLESVDRLGRTRGDAGDLGTAIHDYVQIWIQAGEEAARQNIPAIVPLARLREFEELRDSVDTVLRQTDFSDLQGIELSMHYEWPIPDGRTVQYEARIDLLIIHAEGTAEIIDWKTGRRVPSSIDEDVQLKSYALVVLRNFPQVWQVTARQAQVRMNRVLSITYSLAELEEFDTLFKIWINEMAQEEEFPPSPGDLCTLCPHVLRCDAGQRLIPRHLMVGDEQVPVILPSDPDERRQHVQQLAAGMTHLKAQASRLEKIVQAYVEEANESVALPDGSAYDFHVSNTINIDPHTFFEQMDQLGKLNWSDFSVDKRALGSLINPRGKRGYTPELEPFVRRERYSKWGLKKATAEEE